MDTLSSDIIKKNFAWLEADAERTDVLYRAVLADLAKELCRDGILPSPADALEAFHSAGQSDTVLFARFCEMLTEGHADEHFTDYSPIPKRVSYLRSPMTDKAFMAFSEMFPGLSAVYGADFKSICEDVYYERSDACILPLESSSDGLLMSFRKLLLKYELCIHSVCEQRQNDDSRLTIALLTSAPSFNGDLLEFYIPSSSHGSIETLCKVTAFFGGTVVRTSTVMSEYSSGVDIHMCIKIADNSKNAFVYCLEALYPSHMILGNYKNFNI